MRVVRSLLHGFQTQRGPDQLDVLGLANHVCNLLSMRGSQILAVRFGSGTPSDEPRDLQSIYGSRHDADSAVS